MAHFQVFRGFLFNGSISFSLHLNTACYGHSTQLRMSQPAATAAGIVFELFWWSVKFSEQRICSPRPGCPTVSLKKPLREVQSRQEGVFEHLATCQTLYWGLGTWFSSSTPPPSLVETLNNIVWHCESDFYLRIKIFQILQTNNIVQDFESVFDTFPFEWNQTNNNVHGLRFVFSSDSWETNRHNVQPWLRNQNARTSHM